MNMIYNGMEFPVLPQSEYTNALIFVVSDGYHLVLSDSAFALRDVDPLLFDGEYRYWARYELDGDAWVARDSQYSSYDPRIDEIIWANYDVLDPEANLYMAKSVPVTIFAVTHTIHADLLERGVRPRIDVVQGDCLTRRVEFVLTAGGVPWTPPDDTTAALSYVRPDGAGKVYDKLDDGSTAYTVSGNRVRMMLLPELMEVAGDVMAALRIVREADGKLLSSFGIDIAVEPEPSYMVRPASNDTPTEPNTPAAASLYIYGTPSTSGNIGLRNGESVTYYDGAVLPKLPDEITQCKHIFVYEMIEGTQYIAYGFDTEPSFVLSTNFLGSTEQVRIVSGQYNSACLYGANTDTCEGWIGIETNQNVSDAALGYVAVKNTAVLWANFDVYTSDGTLYRAKNDPTPVSGLVGYKCGDWEVPVFDIAEYPFIHVLQDQHSDDTYIVVVTDREMAYKNSGGYIQNNIRAVDDSSLTKFRKSTLKSNGVMVDSPEWEVINTTGTIDGTTSGGIGGTLIWSSYKLTSDDGLVAPEASEPIPVYE